MNQIGVASDGRCWQAARKRATPVCDSMVLFLACWPSASVELGLEFRIPRWPSASVELGLKFRMVLCHHPTVTGGHNRKSSDSCNLESGVHKHPPSCFQKSSAVCP